MKSFFSHIEARRGERLVQGAVLFALKSDDIFKRKFSKWLSLSSDIENVKEEVKRKQHRHDLVLVLKDGSKKNVELKLWANWTTAQWDDPESIDFIIIPE